MNILSFFNRNSMATHSQFKRDHLPAAPALDFNPLFEQAHKLMEETSGNLFVTGRAGTGKSTLLNYFRAQTKKRLVVLAPTGVAAINVAGQTIHSFFGFKPDITLSKIKRLPPNSDKRELFEKLQTVVIDEVSMVRADLLDCVEKFLRLNGPEPSRPFGGAQMIFIGDLYQLPPVVRREDAALFAEHYQSPYFFSAKVFQPGSLFNRAIPLTLIELEKIYRQHDDVFIGLLNSVRNNSAGPEDLTALNARVDAVFEPPRRGGQRYITLTTTNHRAREINEAEIDELPGKAQLFEAVVHGNFEETSFPADRVLTLKPGAQIMLVNNDPARRWVNGTLATVAAIEAGEAGEPQVTVTLANGRKELVGPNTWELFAYQFDRRSKQIETETVGTFTQLPIKLAWAVTIHKSQGKTFERVIVDLERGTFAHGQLYVALSRCTSLAGLVLRQPLQKRHILMDWRVVKFVTQFQYAQAAEQFSLDDKVKLLETAITTEQPVQITYLKNNDVKSRRQIVPRRLGAMEYLGKKFLGVEAFCLERQDTRVFRVDRILEMEVGETID